MLEGILQCHSVNTQGAHLSGVGVTPVDEPQHGEQGFADHCLGIVQPRLDFLHKGLRRAKGLVHTHSRGTDDTKRTDNSP